MGTTKDKQYYVGKQVQLYGQFYDYSQYKFIGASYPGIIICPIHGPFTQSFSEHLRYKCKGCGRDSKKKLVCGIGINDQTRATAGTAAYTKWHMMLYRCTQTTGKSVHPDWLMFSNFEHWLIDYKDTHYPDTQLADLDLDKDLLGGGSGEYGPHSCCLLPSKLNKLLGNQRCVPAVEVLKYKIPKYLISVLIGISLEEPKIGDRFYMQQGLSVSDFKLGTFKNKPTKAAVVDEIKKVLPFIGPKTFANTTNLANLLEVVEWLKSEKLVVTAAPGSMPIVNKKQPYMDAIADSSSFTEPSLLKLFTIQGLRDFVRFINNEAGNS